MRALYTAGILIYRVGISIAAFFNPKAKRWIDGRKQESKYSGNINLAGCIWMHCASLGEFEQGRPVLEQLKRDHPIKPILLTFFSPSGYDIRKNYPGADHVAYLPLDTTSKAEGFIKTYQPAIAIFVKYEVWHNFLHALKRHHVPVILISAIFRRDHIYFKPWGAWFRSSLKTMTMIFAQDQGSINRLNSIGITSALVAGDTRFDRVNAVQLLSEKEPIVEAFAKTKRLIVAGSTWERDEELLVGFFNKQRQFFPDLGLVIVPHEISSEHLSKLKNLAPEAQLWTETTVDTKTESSILIINTIGLLSKLFKYAYITYIGGGFGAGIHNILEPAAYGKPVVLGPKHEKFKEAQDLIALGGAWSITSADTLEKRFLQLLNDASMHAKASDISGKYVQENTGATAKICDHILSILKS